MKKIQKRQPKGNLFTKQLNILLFNIQIEKLKCWKYHPTAKD
jgi:hypothetical protein